MAEKAKNVILNFKMDGQVQYAKTLREINAIMNTAAKEYKSHVSAMGDDATATDKLRAEKKKLEIQMEAAQKRTEMLRNQYDQMSKSTKTTTAQLTQMYSKLLDAENAEVSLQKSLDRVNGGLSDQAIEARDAKVVLNSLQTESKTLEAEQKNLTSSFKLQNAQLGENASESQKTELAQKQLSSQMELTDRVVKNLEKQLEQTKKVYGENSIEVMQLETKINGAKTNIAEFGSKLESLKSSGQTAESGLDGVNKKLSAAVFLEAAEAIQGVTDKLLEMGKAAMESGLSFGDSQTYLQANLGLTADEAEKLNGVVNDVFKNGVVGSMDEAAQAVMIVKQSFGDLNNADLEKLTNQITTISKRTGTDVQENVNAASRLMTEFGISGQEAMDLIAAGYQNGLNKSGDFLDTLNEYAPHFQAAGYSADEMMQIIQNGMENGALNTDKAADAVKEFQIRLGDGSFEKVMGSFGKGTQDVFQKWKDGKATVSDVAQSISGDLNKMSPKEQQEALSLLSSQFEDLGVDGAAALFSVGDAFKDTTGKAEEMSKKSPGEEWESSLRELQQSLLPIGQSLVDALTPVIDILVKMGEWFSNLPGPIQTFVTAFGGIIAVVGILSPIIAAIAGAFMFFGGSVLLPIIGIIAGVAAAIAAIIVVVQNWGAITDWIKEKYGQFKDWLGETTGKLKDDFVNKYNEMKDGAINKVTELKDKALEMIGSFKDNVVNKAGEIKDGFVNKVTELKDGVIGKYNELKTNALNVVSSFKDNVVGKVGELKSDFINRAGELKDGALGKFNDLRDKAGQVMREAKDKILSPIREAKETISGIVDEIAGFFSNMKLKIPKIDMPPLPHFKLEGEFSLKPPSVPHLSIDWYKDGAIFTKPTIFNTPFGLKGFGEAGPEAALPLNEETLGSIGEGIAKNMKGNGVTQHITIVSPDPTSPSENARKFKQASRQLAMEW